MGETPVSEAGEPGATMTASRKSSGRQEAPGGRAKEIRPCKSDQRAQARFSARRRNLREEKEGAGNLP